MYADYELRIDSKMILQAIGMVCCWDSSVDADYNLLVLEWVSWFTDDTHLNLTLSATLKRQRGADCR